MRPCPPYSLVIQLQRPDLSSVKVPRGFTTLASQYQVSITCFLIDSLSFQLGIVERSLSGACYNFRGDTAHDHSGLTEAELTTENFKELTLLSLTSGGAGGRALPGKQAIMVSE